MYLPTVDSATSISSINNSPCMRGAPHSGFSRFIRRISARIPAPVRGTAAEVAGLPVPVGAKTAAMPTNNGFGLDNNNCVQERRIQSIQPRHHQAIELPESHALR